MDAAGAGLGDQCIVVVRTQCDAVGEEQPVREQCRLSGRGVVSKHLAGAARLEEVVHVAVDAKAPARVREPDNAFGADDRKGRLGLE